MADPRFRNIEFKVGLFALIAVITVVVVIVAVGFSRDILVNKVNINVYTDTGDDVSKGMPVKYSGFTISRVDSIRLQNDGRVVIRIGIPTKYIKWVRQDSVFKLGSLNIIGGGYISISTNLESTAPIITSDSTFTLERDQGIQAVIDKAIPAIDDLKEIISNINVILGRAADEDGDISKLLRGLGALGNDISNKEGTLGFLIRSDYIQDEVVKFLKDLRSFSEKAVVIATNVESGSYVLNSALNKLDTHIDPIMKNTYSTTNTIEEMVISLKPTIKRIDEITIHLENVAKNAADGTQNLDVLRAEIQSIVETGNSLLLKLENIWPISIGNDKPKEVPLK